MALENDPNAPKGDPTSITPGRYTEERAPQFVGGNTDPVTGNLVQSYRSDGAGGSVTPPAPKPAESKTRLGEIDAPKMPGTGKMLADSAVGFAAPYVGAQVGGKVGAGVPLGDAFSTTAKEIGSSVSGALGSGGGSAVGSGAGASAGGIGSDFAASAAASKAGSVPGAAVSGLGGAVGAGIGTALAGAISGQKPKEYVPASIGSAVGFYIGNAVLPGIGGFVGSAIGSLFCHAAGTKILMGDGSRKQVQDLKIGDLTLLGGKVLGRGEVQAEIKDLFVFDGTIVTGRHAVFEDGRWLRVEDSPRSIRMTGEGGCLVYPIVTEKHLLVCDRYICADLAETDDADMSASERLAKLNAAAVQNAELRHAEELLGFNVRSAA